MLQEILVDTGLFTCAFCTGVLLMWVLYKVHGGRWKRG